MLIKVREASGPALDWMVSVVKENSRPFPIWIDGKPRCLAAYSTDWSFGGPIIEREKIILDLAPSGWACMMFENENQVAEEYGPTPLIAAMRCFVASKLGDEVEVPDGLT